VSEPSHPIGIGTKSSAPGKVKLGKTQKKEEERRPEQAPQTWITGKKARRRKNENLCEKLRVEHLSPWGRWFHLTCCGGGWGREVRQRLRIGKLKLPAKRFGKTVAKKVAISQGGGGARITN